MKAHGMTSTEATCAWCRPSWRRGPRGCPRRPSGSGPGGGSSPAMASRAGRVRPRRDLRDHRAAATARPGQLTSKATARSNGHRGGRRGRVGTPAAGAGSRSAAIGPPMQTSATQRAGRHPATPRCEEGGGRAGGAGRAAPASGRWARHGPSPPPLSPPRPAQAARPPTTPGEALRAGRRQFRRPGERASTRGTL